MAAFLIEKPESKKYAPEFRVADFTNEIELNWVKFRIIYSNNKDDSVALIPK